MKIMAKNLYFQGFLVIFLAIISQLASSNELQPTNNGHENNEKAKMFKGMFVFGTSVVDNGNNNYIQTTLSKANYHPYGLDFPFGPTGRFSNGKTVADSISDLLHLPIIPPFADPNTKADNLVHGVNYGSGGSGILDETGSISVGVVTMNQQIRNFEGRTLPEMKTMLGDNSEEKLGQYLFMVAAGNNDLEMNYFLQNSSSRPPLPIFVHNLTSTFTTQLKRLYELGARKFALLTIYPIGCTPVVKDESGSQKCIHLVNKAAHYYNVQLRNLVDDLKQKMPCSEFVVVNTYKIIRDIIKNPLAKGFTDAARPCCELQKIRGVGILCKEGGHVCSNRSSYVFFDGQHTTEAVNAIIATKAFSSHRKTEAYPFNLQQLARL